MSRIHLENVTLYYGLPSENISIKMKAFTLMRDVLKRKKNREFICALNNLSFDIQDGDRIGLIGRNGAGKSTLLRLLSGIYFPNSGRISIQGSVSSILDVGIGLNLEASGYDNILLIGILYGKTKKEMRSKFKEIEEFTELGRFLKLPVRTYSSGMMLRLAFAIITSINPDILLLDEIIGVGDELFMQKAKTRLTDLITQSNILVLSSHSMEIIQQFCNKTIVLNQGDCLYFGPVDEGITTYHNFLQEHAHTA